MTRMYPLTIICNQPLRAALGLIMMASLGITGCTTNYLTNSATGTYGVPVTERTIPQRLLDRSIEHTAKINIYGLQENLQQQSRLSIDSFNSEVLLTGEVPTEAIKSKIEQVLKSMPDVRRVYNELQVGVARGYSSTVQDGYITSKLMAKIATSDGVKSSQLKAVTDNGVVYIMGRMTPTQQSNLIDIANDTAGVTELVLFTTLVNDIGTTISNEDIMTDPSLTSGINVSTPSATAVIRTPINAPANNANVALTTNDYADVANPPTSNNSSPSNPSTTPESSSPYIDLYQDQYPDQ